MSRSPQDVYARYLLSSRGYPLWIPEPSHQLLLSRPDGLRIGDVGVVVPEDGGFEVFFNICLPREHPFHRATGVPDNFKHVEVRDEDIRIIPRVENPGRIISTSSVTRIRTVEPPTGNDTPGARLGGLGYEFDLSSSGGALLILPEGAERHELRNHRLFFEEATRHGDDWYRFAEERLGRMISHDSLYLITGFYKARSWSLAAFENAAGSGEFSAQFKMAQVGGSNIAGTYTWETTRALDWRVGPAESYGFPNQSVFIRGFKVALRTGLLGKKRIEVKAGAPSTSSKHGRFSHVVKRDSWISNVWKGLSRGSRPDFEMDMRDEVVTDLITDRASDAPDFLSLGVPHVAGKHVVVQHMPELSEIFHPSDIINQYLLKKEASANIVVTHDDVWITMLEKGQLKPEDFVQANPFQVEAIVTNNFHVVSHGGVAFLQGKSDVAVNNDGPYNTIHEFQGSVVPGTQSNESIPKIPDKAQPVNEVLTTDLGPKDDTISEERGAVQANVSTDNPPGTDSDGLVNPICISSGHRLPEAQSNVTLPLSITASGNVETSGTADQPPGFTSIGTQGSQGMQGNYLDPPLYEDAPPPEYMMENLDHPKSTDVAEKLHLLPESLGGIHWLLQPYHPRISKHLLRFDTMFPVDRICYQYSNNVRDRIPDEDLDGLASNELTTKMRITFEQRPFNWIIDVDNPKGIRCRDVFGAMYDSFNQQLTLEELWRVTNRGACEEAFRIRNLVLGNPQMEWSLGWKRVDVLLHHTIFHGLTMNPEGDLVLNLGAPLPVPNLPRSLSLSRRNSSSTEVESGESSDESVNLSLPATLVPRGLHNTGAGSAETSNTHPSPLIVLEVLPRQQSVLSRPIRRPLGPRPRRNR